MNLTSLRANGAAVARMAVTRRAAAGAAVLGYHDVRADGEPGDEHYTVSATQLRAHIDTVRRAGLQIVALADIVERLASGRPVDGLAAITFDDALVGVHRHALPVLRELQVPATVFVVTDAIGVSPPWWPGAVRTMTADELREAKAAGVDLHSHSSVHASLPALAPDVRTPIWPTAAPCCATPSAHRPTCSPTHRGTTPPRCAPPPPTPDSVPRSRS